MPPPGRPSIPQATSAFYAVRLRTPQIIRVGGDASGTVRIDGGDPVTLDLTLTDQGRARAFSFGFDGQDGQDGLTIPGPAGPAGAAGSAGAVGAAGPQGPPGLNGEDGEDGFPGLPGVQGPAGAVGATGATGAIGPTGALVFGLDGDEGPEGFAIPGAPGPTGSPGATGATGPAGPIGFGLDGDEGPEGFPIPGPAGVASGAGPSVTLAQLAANASISSTGSPSVYSWVLADIRSDTLNTWAAGSPTKFTVPAGYTKARITMYMSWAANSTNFRYMYIKLTGASAFQWTRMRAINESSTSMVSKILTGLVAATDYIEVAFGQDSGGNLNLLGAASLASEAAYMQIEWFI